MDQKDFRNSLCLLHSIDSWELDNPKWYMDFASNPVGFYLRSDDSRADLIWAAMVKRGVGSASV